MSRRTVEVRRIYDDPSPADGTRVLVDRLWPRGVSHATARAHRRCARGRTKHLRQLAKRGPLTLLTATADVGRSEAAVLL